MADSYQQDLLATLLPQWQRLLQGWSADGSLVAAAQEALVPNGTPSALEDLIIQWSARVSGSMPPIALSSEADINGALGAYGISTGTHQLNAGWAAGAKNRQSLVFLTEKRGNKPDSPLNTADQTGEKREDVAPSPKNTPRDLEKSTEPKQQVFRAPNTKTSSVSAQTLTTGDTTPPTLVSLMLSSYQIDLASSSTSITATARLADDISGVGNPNTRNAEVRWISPSGNQFIDASFFGYSTGSDLDATFQNAFPITFNPNSEVGIWGIQYARVNDEAGNTKTYSKQELEALGIQTTLNVVGGQSDTTPPVLVSLMLSSYQIDLASSSTSITATARLADDISGVGNPNTRNAEVRWISPSGNQFIDASFFGYSTGSDLDATFQNAFPITFNPNSEVGIWGIQYARVNDEAGNTKTYSKQELEALGIQTTLNVVGGQSDTTPPALVSLMLSSYQIDLASSSTSITATARLADDISGVGNPNTRNAEVRWISPSGNQFIDASFFGYSTGSDLDATFQNAFPITFNPNSEVGIWGIQYARVNDEAGNTKTYSKQELEALGIQATLNVVGGQSDTTPAAISSISTQGTTVILKFSESISDQPISRTAFTVATVDSKNRATPRTISTVARDLNDPTKLILTLSGKAPASNVNLQVSYTDPAGTQSTGDVQDLAGNDLASFSNHFADTFVSSSTTTLASQYQNLILSGTSGFSGTGNALANTITGNTGSNTLSGLAGYDTLTGGNGDDTLIGGTGSDVLTGGVSSSDTFRFALADSLLGATGTPGFDRITDLEIGSDRIDGPSAVTAANLRELGSVSALTDSGIAAVLTFSTFAGNGAATFTYLDGSTTRTFLALNNGTDGYSSSTDAIIEITGFSGAPTSLAIV